MIWANLLHLSYNMWGDFENPQCTDEYICAKPYLRCDYDLWRTVTEMMAEVGMNMVVIDLGDGVRYNSRPEIAVEGAWTTEFLTEELKRLRGLGLEPIPKLNFSATHDVWMKDYARQLSSPPYYAACADLISEVCELFDKPRFFHLGMDEETFQYQQSMEYIVVRQFDLWWKDLLFLVEQAERAGSRAWIWSDYVWNHPELFYERMPKGIVQSNWYYGEEFGPEIDYVRPYTELEAHGYDQIPTGSNWSSPTNFERTVEYCVSRIAPDRLLGFLQTPWKPTLPECRQHHIEAVQQVGQVIKRMH
jgi:hypothetical protein